MVEYRVRPVVRYIVTKYLAPSEHTAGFSHVICECDVESDAELIRSAMQAQDAGLSQCAGLNLSRGR